MPTAPPLDQEAEPQARAAPGAPDSPTSSADGSDRMDAAGGPANGDHDDGSSAPRDAGEEPREEEEGEWQMVEGKKKQQRPGRGDIQPSTSPSLNRPERPQQQQRQQQQVEAEAEDSDSDSEDSDDDGDEGGIEVQLGFAEPVEPEVARRLLFRDPNWLDWDGGKIGGRPIWLNPRDLPKRAALDCAGCGEPLAFILQIYCPLDDPPGAFHRALYVFCCRKPRCTGPGCAKVFRCQLPRANPFYPHDPKKDQEGSSSSQREELAAKTCDVCGQGADKTCAGCKRAAYCSRTHQKEAWRAGHKLECTRAATEGEEAGLSRGMGHHGGQLRSVLPEYEIVIEEEASPAGEGKDAEEERRREDEALLQKYQDVYVGEAAAQADEDAQLGQRDLDRAVGADPALKDRQSLKFLAVIGKEPDQVLRYARWRDGAPLWVATAGRPPKQGIPPCERCGAARAFEFQAMPQLLHYLRVDAEAQLPQTPGEACRLGAMDWGTLAAYTCTGSCDAAAAEEGGYVEEVLWRQQPMA